MQEEVEVEERNKDRKNKESETHFEEEKRIPGKTDSPILRVRDAILLEQEWDLFLVDESLPFFSLISLEYEQILAHSFV